VENSLIFTLFGLLFWDIIFDEHVPLVFLSGYQSAPLDLGYPSFYLSRKQQIDQRLADLYTPILVRALVDTAFEQHRGTACKGVQWNAWDKVFLGDIAVGMGGACLAVICKALSLHYNDWGGGLPDLCLWRDKQQTIAAAAAEEEGNEVLGPSPPSSHSRELEVCLVEVKGPRDRLSQQQQAWLDLLAPVLNVHICQIHEQKK
jgi:Fanconi-associated nuclease 1